MIKVNKYFVPYVMLLVIIGFRGELLLAFFIAVLHEAAHYLMAKHLGFKGFDVEILPVGTALCMRDLEDATDEEDMIISIAGPLSNFLLAGLFYLMNLKIQSDQIHMFIQGNLAIGLFNLVPAFPLDGSRILRDLIGRWMFYKKAKMLVLNLSVTIGIITVLTYIAMFFKGMNNFSIGMIGVFIIISSLKERERIAYVIMGDIIKKKAKFMKRGFLENRSMSVHYKKSLLDMLMYVDKNKYNIFMVLDDEMKVLDIMYEEDVIEALKMYGNISLCEYMDIQNQEHG